MIMESISSTKNWFEIWFDAFGNNQGGIWHPDNIKPNPGIPYQRVEQIVGKITISTATGAVNSHTPRYDIMGTLREPCSVLRQMMRDLDVSMLTFPYISLRSNLGEALDGLKKKPLYHLDFCESSPHVKCTGSWDDYWARRGKKSRQECMRNERRLKEKDMKFICLTSKVQAEEVLDEVLEVEASGWKGKDRTAIRYDPEALRFYKLLVSAWADHGLLRLFLIRNKVDGIIAFQLCGLYKGVLSSLKIGYQQKFSKLSPGQVLQMQTVRWAFEQPDVEIFDMLGPATQSKLKWSSDEEYLYTLRVFRPNIPGLIAWMRFCCGPAIKKKLSLIKTDFTGSQNPV